MVKQWQMLSAKSSGHFGMKRSKNETSQILCAIVWFATHKRKYSVALPLFYNVIITGEYPLECIGNDSQRTQLIVL